MPNVRFVRGRSGGLAAVLTLFIAVPASAQETLPWSERGRSVAGVDDTYRAGNAYGGGDTYRPNEPYNSGNAYRPSDNFGRDDAYRSQDSYGSQARSDSFSDPDNRPNRDPSRDQGGYGEPYQAPRAGPEPYDRNYGDQPPVPPHQSNGYYEQGEIIGAGHRFFGSISEGLASAVEYAFKSQGRPNGYILGEDAGGAFVLGLRYGEGRLYTKDAGNHPVYWQGPSIGYDAGAEGSKTMVLVYNLRDPSEIYHRFAGVQGAAYLVGGISIQFQKYGDVMLGVIRSGVGLRLGANVGYLKYTRSPTWNPL